MLVPVRVVGAIVAAVLMLTFWVGSAGAENRIYLKCESDQGTFVTNGDMAAESIGDELASLVGLEDFQGFNYSSLALSYHEGGQSTYVPGGSGSGTFLHGGLTVVRPVAKSSPKFWRALALGTSWIECTLYFTRQSVGSSSNVKYFEIRIEEVIITQIEPRAVAQLEAPGTGRSHLEAITFAFRKITWSHIGAGGTTSFSFNIETGEPLK